MGFYAKDEPAHPAPERAVSRTLSRARKPRPENAWLPIWTVGIGHRFYSPGLGRWMSRDPLGEGIFSAGLYAAARNALCCRFDYLGLIDTVTHEHPDPKNLVPVYVQWPQRPRTGGETGYPMHDVVCECLCPKGKKSWTIACTVRWTAEIRINAEQTVYGENWPGIYGHEQRHVLSMIAMVEQQVCQLLRGKKPFTFAQKERCEEMRAKYQESAQKVMDRLVDWRQTPDHKWDRGASPDSPAAGQPYPPLEGSPGHKPPPSPVDSSGQVL